MLITEKEQGFWLRLKSGVSSVFKQSPVSFSVTLLILLFASVTAIGLAISDHPGKWSASIPVAAALLVVLDNLRCRIVSQPIIWPRWLTVLALLNTVVGAGYLFLSYIFDVEGETVISTASFYIAMLVITLVLLPRLLTLFNRVLGFIPLFGSSLSHWLTAQTLYSLLFVTFAVYFLVVQDYDSDYLYFVTVFIFSFGMAIWLRQSLWSMPGYSLLARTLPHIPAWTVVLATWLLILSDGAKIFRVEENLVYIYFLALALIPIVSAYLFLQKLQRSPVTLLSEQISHRADSIQSRAEHYVDVHGLSTRLATSIERSDGGVFGVTGLRGAGKSALTRHVLSKLEPSYFTLEVTAPVRHDQDMGFFIALCRAVCRKTLDDLSPILHGAGVGVKGKLWEKIRNFLLVLFALVAASSLWVALQKGDFRIVRGGQEDGYVTSPDPLLGWTSTDLFTIIEAERSVVDHLIAQISLAVAKGEHGDAQRYLLVPSAKKIETVFWLLRQLPESDSQRMLLEYRERLNENEISLDPGDFLFSSLNWDVRERLLETAGFHDYYGDFYLRKELKEKWALRTEEILRDSQLAVPLSHLNQEIRYHLGTTAHQQPAKKPPGNSSATAKADSSEPLHLPAPAEPITEPQFISSLILDAFLDSNPRLSFDVTRLRQFQEVLQVYRSLLDGDVFPRPATQQSNPSEVLNTSLAERLYSLNNTDVVLFWSAAGAIILLLFAGPVWGSMSNLARAMVNRRYLNLYAEAEGFIEQLTFQSSRENSAGLSYHGISLGRKQTLDSRDLTLPGLTARYINFLEKVRSVYNGKIVIAIDELDKVHDPEQVKALLVEIKGALFSTGTFYIISISEDAARSFRSRLASGRDIFESTFDDVFDIDRINVDAAVSILERLELTGDEKYRLPLDCLEVAAMFGGGIPREIIRARRTLSFAIEGQVDATPAWAVRTLIKEELEKWGSHLGESDLSGADTIRIRQFFCTTLEALEAGSDSSATYASLWDILEPSIQIIDPEQLRKSVGYLSEYTSASSVLSDEQTGYQRIVCDLQMILRLLILIHSCELILWPHKSRNSYEKPLLECHRALADKPALAETLLYELRDETVGS